ncbi:thiamine pyrophosphate-binding protein [Paenibacillus sp. CAU 1782]
MRAARAVLEFLSKNGTTHLFGIPAGSVNAFFDELYDMPELDPIVTKHEGAASYMAAAYARYSGKMSVCIGCSGPGATNLVTGAANAMREHLPVLFLTGAVPVGTMGANASQELDVAPIFRPVTKYSVLVKKAEDVLDEIVKACGIAVSGVPGPVHVALPIDVQHANIGEPAIPTAIEREDIVPDAGAVQKAAAELASRGPGFILMGQGARDSVDQLVELAERLNWPIATTPQAKGYLPADHRLNAGIFGFAGHESASSLVGDDSRKVVLIAGSSLGETATNNYNAGLTQGRYVIQLDFDETVFGRKYGVDLPLLGDMERTLPALLEELGKLGIPGSRATAGEAGESGNAAALQAELTYAMTAASSAVADPEANAQYNTRNVLANIQRLLPDDTRYTVDIGEFMSYVIHHMPVKEKDTFGINVHFGAMGIGIGSAIGSKLAEPDRPVVSITGDGCFFMHGMEILTSKEKGLPILFIVMNNARLGMVYHGHSLQFKRVHSSFEQQFVNIAAMADAMGIPNYRVGSLEDITQEAIDSLLQAGGPAVLEVVLVDNGTPPMGDRVKFLSSFGK